MTNYIHSKNEIVELASDERVTVEKINEALSTLLDDLRYKRIESVVINANKKLEFGCEGFTSFRKNDNVSRKHINPETAVFLEQVIDLLNSKLDVESLRLFPLTGGICLSCQ